MSNLTYDTIFNPDTTITGPLDHGLARFNRAALGDYDYARVAVTVTNDDGDIIGGIYGDLLWDWLYIQTLWVDEAYRGRGIATRLLRQAEQVALARGIHKLHVETTSFQAWGVSPEKRL